MRGLRRYLVELVATLLLTVTVLGAASQDVLLGALAIGAVVAVLLGTGAHANPVLSLAAVLGRRLPASDLLPCWAAQFVGALLGAALGRWLVDAPAVSPLQDLGVLALLVAQLLFAFLLCYAV
ncbi:MAG TPA: aquaporin, partial [Nocardioidaceae bacterium]|nr:aquaporin [Nocardioidaceae bacterium]